MIREVNYNGTIIRYELTRKRVKNINLRIKSDGTVVVSANRRVSADYIDSFVIRKGDFILKAVQSYKNNICEALRTEEELKNLVAVEFEKVYSHFRQYGIDRPTLKFRKMKSRWGSCNYIDCVITLSSNLVYCTDEQIFYVVVHEFSHLIVHNHSKDFYGVVEKLCPDYKRIRKEMNNIVITE